jgi:hypothetical protein
VDISWTIIHVRNRQATRNSRLLFYQALFLYSIVLSKKSLCCLQQIYKFIHFSDNEAWPPECEAKLHTERPVLNFLVSKFQQVYVPEKQISIDEGMIPRKDRLIFKVYKHNRPDRYSIKACLVSESKSCYICNMDVYTGKSCKAYSNNTNSKVCGERKKNRKGETEKKAWTVQTKFCTATHAAEKL